MIGILAAQLVAIAGVLLLLCLPGWAVSRLLELHLRMPTVAIPAMTFTLGLGVWTLVLLPLLALEQPMGMLLFVYAVVTAALVAWARLRDRKRGHAKRGSDALSGWTVAAIVLACLAALALRTRMAFDTLFHVGLVRRIAELGSPAFDNLDRVVGSGVNPAYAVPTWQAAMAAVSRITGLDVTTVVEAMAVVGVLMAASAAAALGRAVSGTVFGEIAGVSAYAWLRVFNPRRELEGDGIAYAALPGNIALDVMLVLTLVVAVLLLQGRGKRDGSLVAFGALSVTLLIVLHANYAVYLALIAGGTTIWLIAAGPWGRAVARRLGLVAATIAVPGLVTFAAILPLLMLLDHFGSPMEERIVYHLTANGDFIRPGHLYDWFAAAGLLGVLILPWAAWRARGVSRAFIGGGSLVLIAFALAPPLVDLLDSTGSRTLSLRMPRPLGIMLVAGAAIALPGLVERTCALASKVGVTRGKVGAWLVRLAPLAAAFALSAAYGYPLARRDPAQYGWNWPTLVALLGLLVVFALAIRSRNREQVEPARSDYVLTARTMGLSMLAIAIAMLPSGVTSLRRGAWQAREVVAAYRADDLRCYDGVQAALRKLPAGGVLLADPVTAYGAQALAPQYVVGDFKVWNGTTDEARIQRRLDLLRATFDSQQAERAGYGLARLAQDFDVTFLLVSRGPVEPPIGSELGTYDARGLRSVLDSGDIGATRIAAGPGRFDANAPEEDREACDLELWKLDGSEHDLEYDADGAHADDDDTMDRGA